MKRCHQCNKILPDFLFSKNRWRKDGKQNECKECQRQYGEINRERIRKYGRRHYRKNKEYVLAHCKEYRLKNRKLRTQWVKNKYHSDTSFRLSFNMAAVIRHSLKGRKNGCKWESLVGYSVSDLREHLEKKFRNGMTWENYGKFWHIDHIIPISLFSYSDFRDREFKQCWALANLQPLLSSENLSKGNRIPNFN
jgi:5-methylcytosine-specific restriction endonuclease McrA